MSENLLRHAFLIWLAEIALSGFNYFILMKKVYEPKLGELRAHQIGLSTRIVYIFLFATLLLTIDNTYSTADLVYIGLLWLTLTLIFEWGGSLLTRRPVQEILIGWHVNRGYMWPFVLASYLLAPLVVGSALRI